MVLLCIATVRLVTYDLFAGAAGVPWRVAGGVVISPWTVLMLGAGAAWLATAFLMLRTVRDETNENGDREATSPRPWFAFAAAAAGVASIGVAPAHPGLGRGGGVSGLVGAVAGVACCRAGRAEAAL
ncbi:MAG: hypothetical protein HND58_16705 [Planctomycetota bacterium]|nr:MAG: hypothetical protein HND58_16705 [Planctomycetota bacterium]